MPMWLRRAQVPPPFLGERYEGLVDIAIENDRIVAVVPAHTVEPGTEGWDLGGGLVLPCLVDCHTHLDKAHTGERAPNPDGTFTGALAALEGDRKNWTASDLYQRMEFALDRSYRHGTRAIRTHLDVPPGQLQISVAVFQELQREWSSRITLQAVSLISLDLFMGEYGEEVANTFAKMGGILGGVAYPHPDLVAQLDRVFSLAKDRQLALDFHVDETNDPHSQCLKAVAEAVLRHKFPYPVSCGHCCSLALQAEETVRETIGLVAAAGINIISLPTCNLYLQDRQPKCTPRWRGITLIHELDQAGIPVAIAHDNCRDAFYPLGDHDLLQIFAIATLIGHLDNPYHYWLPCITTTPARIMGIEPGLIAPGSPADLLLFASRTYTELLSFPPQDRQVLRNGKRIDT
ncbi:MAG: cytosine deaminase [Pseudanabaenaceae cyanobacterium SKYGB_i_bin29]|nr:cytosine deaminase [Pseudanabaenaceae cyanobacterium SKYG29]MDW8420862.1 cytosine deaminase [Pseudanabaenaceae cyanobacterium SKYGB_i_bin29]